MKYCAEITAAILELQRKNRNIAAQDLATNIILILLSQHSELNLSQLAEYLNCPQSYLTHLLKRLIDKKFIRMRQDRQDLRYRYYSLTAAGEKMVETLDRHYNSVLQLQERNLPKAEMALLCSSFARLCDRAGIVSQSRRPHDHILRPQQRRLAALLGVTGRTLLGLKITSTNFHILRYLSAYSGLLTTKALAISLNIASAQISLTLKDFSKQGWIKYSDNPFDERSRLIVLTTAGETHFSNLAESLYKQMGMYLSEFSQSEAQSFAAAAHKFVATSLKIVIIAQKEFPKIRAIILEYCYLNETLATVPERIAGKNDRIFALINNDERACYVQVQAESNQINLIAWQPGLSLVLVFDFLKKVISDNIVKVDNRNNGLHLIDLLRQRALVGKQ